MIFRAGDWVNPNLEGYHKENVDLAQKYAKAVFKEFGEFVKAVVLFGSLTKDTLSPGSDIDVLTVIDDTFMTLTQEVLDSYEIINQRIILDISPKLHIHTVSLTSFWDFVREGDPVMMNILRDGVALVDSNFILPIQKMLYQGRIKPSQEAVYNYVKMAPQAVFNANLRILQGVVDLYWCVVDVTHALLMKNGELPTSPEHVQDLMNKYKIFSRQDKKLFNELYYLSRDIIHRKKNYITGKQFDFLRKKTIAFYEKIKKEIGL